MRLSNGEVMLSWPLAKHLLTVGMYYLDKNGKTYSKWHGAVDLRCSWNGTSNQPVFAAEDGIVNQVQNWDGHSIGGTQSYGNMVKIQHNPVGGKSLQTRYAHLSQINVTAGESVKTGQVIGYTGNTGNSAGAHLHFEVIFNGTRYNPLCWLDDDFEIASGFNPYTFGDNEHSVFNIDGMDVFAVGLDVSKYQGEIDWKLVEASGKARFCYPRAVSTNKDGIYIDQTFERNYNGCKSVGIPVGAYYYTYAADRPTVFAELTMLRKALDGKELELPVAIDVEENTLRPLSKKDLTDLVLLAASEIEKWGYTPIVYSGRNYSINEIDLHRIKQAGVDCWIADYTGNQPKVRHTMWQYTSQGRIPGISGNVDLNYAYKDYTKGKGTMKYNDLHGMRLKAISTKKKCETFPTDDVNATPIVNVPVGDSVKILAVSNDKHTLPGTNISAPWFKVQMQSGVRYAFGLDDVWSVIPEPIPEPAPEPKPEPKPEPAKGRLVITGLDEASKLIVAGLAMKFGGTAKEE